MRIARSVVLLPALMLLVSAPAWGQTTPDPSNPGEPSDNQRWAGQVEIGGVFGTGLGEFGRRVESVGGFAFAGNYHLGDSPFRCRRRLDLDLAPERDGAAAHVQPLVSRPTASCGRGKLHHSRARSHTGPAPTRPSSPLCRWPLGLGFHINRSDRERPCCWRNSPEPRCRSFGLCRELRRSRWRDDRAGV